MATYSLISLSLISSLASAIRHHLGTNISMTLSQMIEYTNNIIVNQFVEGTLSSLTCYWPIVHSSTFYISGTPVPQCYSAITTISFPLCTTIEEDAFRGLRSLQMANFPKCIEIGEGAFMFASLQSMNLPKCTTIGADAFEYCYSLQSISLPSCTTIGSYAFGYCSKLQSIYLLNSNICTLDKSNAFYNTPIYDSSYLGYYGSIYVPTSLVNTYKTAENWSYYAEQIVGYVG